MTPTPIASPSPSIGRDHPHSLSEGESSLLSRILSSAQECLEDFEVCLPESLTPGVKYLWVPVAVVVGVIAKVNLTYLALSILGLLALQLIYVHLPERVFTPYTEQSTNSREIDISSYNPVATTVERIAEQPVVESERAFISNTQPSLIESSEAGSLLPSPAFSSGNLDELLATAAIRGNTQDIQDLLRRGANINNRERNLTPLMWAVTYGKREAVELLLNQRADINSQQGTNRSTALICAARRGYTSIVELLVARGANLHHEETYGYTALRLARSSGHRETAQVLQQLQSRLPSPDLLTAVEVEDEAQVREFIKQRADLNHQGPFGVTPLIRATLQGHVGIVHLLLEAGANVNQSTKNHRTALMLAAENGHVEIVTRLLGKSADITPIDNYGHTALTLAARDGHTAIVQLLGRCDGINLNYRTPRGTTALSLARSNNNEETAQALIELGATDSPAEAIVD